MLEPFKHISMNRRIVAEKSDPVSSDCRLHESLSRTRRIFFDYAMCNQFDLFVTITFDRDKYDATNYDLVRKQLCQWLRNYKYRYDPDFRYMFVPEQHKDGSWHFHGLCTVMCGLCTPLKIPKRIKSQRTISGGVDSYIRYVPNTPRYMTWPKFVRKFGWFSCSFLHDYERSVRYMTKYISKSFSDGFFKNKQLVLKSNGLKKPELLSRTYENIRLEDGFCTGYCTIAWRDTSGLEHRDATIFEIPSPYEYGNPEDLCAFEQMVMWHGG